MPKQDGDSVAGPELLQARVSELRAVIDTLPLATAVKDWHGRFLYANAAAAPGYGVAAHEMIGALERDLLPPGNDLEDVLAKDREVIDSGRSLTVPGFRFRTRGGRTMVLHMTRDPVRFEGAAAVLVTAMDVTDSSEASVGRRKIERRLAEAQRLEGLWLMAGGIAHDFNNLLVGVLGNADLALREVATNARAKTFIERIKSAADRLAGLSRQMLAYSGRGHVDIAPIDLPALTKETLVLLEAAIPARMRLETSLPEDLPLVEGDRSQLSQVITNLVINASEAIADGAGTIRVAAQQEFLDSHRTASLVTRSVRGATDHICLEVSDDGPGMDEVTRSRMFDPFFTTKATQGRGLGLAAVIGIVRAHQGGLQVDSTPGEGTRVRVWLPLARDRARMVSPRIPDATPARVGCSVLIVDDEAVVRETTTDALEDHGFVVQTAEDGDGAIETVRRIGRVDVVLLDMTMPGLSVSDTHRALRKMLPDVPILLASGYNEPKVLTELLEEAGTEFIQKPFSGAALLERLHQLLP